MKENKLVVLGAGGVGKTSLVLQFLQGFFSPTYKPTVEDCYSHTLQLPNGLFHSLEILDTSGSHNFPAMRELSIRSGRAFIIVFAVNNEQSFYESQALWNLIKEVKGFDNVPCVLVGNKVDLSAEREVTWEEANNYVTEAMLNAAYVDTSAKYNLNVTLVFKELLVLTFGIGEEKKERRPSRIRLSLSDLSLTTRRKSSSAMSTGSGAAALSSSGISRTGSGLSSSSDCSPDDENANKSSSSPLSPASSAATPESEGGGGGGAAGGGRRLSLLRQDKCVIF